MKTRLTMIFASLFLCLGTALAQTEVNGTVVSSEDGQPVIGASIQAAGTNVGVVTDLDGKFSLTMPKGKTVLRVSYVGMETVEVVGKRNMRIVLKADQTDLDEVMVVAYGTAKKSSFTGSAEQRERFISGALAYSGLEYDYDWITEDPSAIFCSELLYHSLKAIDIHVRIRTRTISRDIFTPDDLFRFLRLQSRRRSIFSLHGILRKKS